VYAGFLFKREIWSRDSYHASEKTQRKAKMLYRRFLPPQVHIISKIGMSDFPRSDKLYSTFGGI
jgi:hypothetical protein